MTDLTADINYPITSCTPITLTFNLEHAEDTAVTDVALRLYLLLNGFTVLESSGFQLIDTQIIGTELAQVFELTDLTIPAPPNPNNPLILTVKLLQAGPLPQIGSEIWFQSFHDGTRFGIETGPNMVPPTSFLSVGSANTETFLDDIEGTFGSLPAAPGNYGDDVVIAGTLVVDVNYTFRSNARLYMQPGAVIRVEDGSSLQVIDITNIEGCTEMWQGIEVERRRHVANRRFHRCFHAFESNY